MEWVCNSCSAKNCNRDFLCKVCQCPRPTSTRKIRPPSHAQRGKFMDKIVMDLVQKATKRKPSSHRAASKNRVKEAIKKKAALRNVGRKRRETLIEKKFKAKTDQIAKLTEELESMRALVFQTSQGDYIQEQLQAIRNIGEIIANPLAYEGSPDKVLRTSKSASNGVTNSHGSDEKEISKVKCWNHLRPSKDDVATYACKHCSFSCKSIWSFCTHLSSKHGVKNSFKCLEEGCNFSTSSKYFLDKHAVSEHGASLKSEEISKKLINSDHTRKNYWPNKGKKKITRPTMIDDADTISKDIELVESLMTDSDEDDRDSRRNNNDTDWVPAEEDDLGDDVDVIIHREEEVLKCPYPDCRYSTSEKYYLTRHRKRKHGEKMPRKKRERRDSNESRLRKQSSPRKKRIKEKKFSCELCGAKATSMWYINRHMRLHTGEKPFVCEFPGCTYKSYRKFHITRHVINIHSTERPHKCELCDYSAKTKENLRQHSLSRHAPGHFEPCEFCDFRAKLKEGLRSHVRKCHKFICKECLWEFPVETDLTKHLQQHREDGLLCDLCPQVCKDIAEFKVHSFTIHGIQIQTRMARKSRSSAATCDVCNYQFTNTQSLEAHKSYHTPDGSIICHFCGFVCKGMDVLKDHTVTQHGCVIDAKPKPVRTYRQKFTCSTCNYELSSRSALETHFQQHRLDGSVKCTKCPHISMKMSDLVQHYLIIHGERLDVSPSKRKNVFACDLCKYSFATASKLENHKNKHQQDGNILCGLCRVTMPSMKELKGHMMLMHGVEMDASEPQELQPISENLCDICNYVFKDKDQLNLHRSCHMADGSICCTMCPYYSPNIEYLVMHMREIHQIEIHGDKSPQHRQKQQLQPPQATSKRDLFKTPQLIQLQNSNALLHTNRTDTLNSVAQSITMTSDVESYIRPPACVFDSQLAIPSSGTAVNNFPSNIITGFSKTDFVDFLQPTLPPPASISITNNNTKFVINNFHNRTLNMGVPNRKPDNRKQEERNTKSDPLSQAVSESGLIASRGNPLPKHSAPVQNKDTTPKAKAFPGLFT